jgi:hypothetical protein
MTELEYIATLPDGEAEAHIFRRAQEWDAARGIKPYRKPVKTRTVPLPLELVFRPGIRGAYRTNKGTADENNTMFHFDFEPGSGSDEPVEDAWEMRDLFVRPDDSDWGSRLDGITLVYGRFGVGVEDIWVPYHKIPKPCHVLTALELFQDEFREWQSLIRAAMTTKMIAWPKLEQKFPAHKVNLLCQPIRLAIEWHDGRPTGIVRCSGILQALIATLQIDALMDAEYRFCACVGCPKSFKVKRKDQRYCDEDCKHRQVVRDGREKQRKETKEPKVRHTERKSK